jgi:hypothetical protein
MTSSQERTHLLRTGCPVGCCGNHRGTLREKRTEKELSESLRDNVKGLAGLSLPFHVLNNAKKRLGAALK